MSTAAGTVTMQARVDAGFARELEADAAVLGLRSASELVREGLRLVHKQARELAMAASYDEFYAGKPAPVSEVTAALWPELRWSRCGARCGTPTSAEWARTRL